MKKSIALMLVGLALLGLGAQEVQPVQAPPQDPSPSSGQEAAPVAAPAEPPMAYGLALLGKKTEESGDFLILADAPGSSFLLKADAEPDGVRMGSILSFVASLRANPGLTAAELRLVNSADSFQALLVPAGFVSASTDLAPALPGGIQFYWSKGSMEYDFRILASRLFLRVRGIYTNCADLGTLAARIVADPQSYITASNPLLILQRIQEGEARLKKAEATIESLKAESFRLGMAAITAQNGGKALKEEAVALVLELKRGDPKLGKAATTAKLREAKLPLQPKELDLVFLVLFGER